MEMVIFAVTSFLNGPVVGVEFDFFGLVENFEK